MERINKYNKVPCVYVAGKLNDDAVGYLNNVHKMMEVAETLRNFGYSYYCPAIDLLMGIKFGYESYHDYFDNSQPWIMRADAIFLVPGWETSAGTKEEIALAEELAIPVFEKIEDINVYFFSDQFQPETVVERSVNGNGV